MKKIVSLKFFDNIINKVPCARFSTKTQPTITEIKDKNASSTTQVDDSDDMRTGKDEKSDDSKTISEIGGPSGPEPTRYGDWERKGRVSDF